MSLNDDNTEPLRDMLPDPPFVAPPEDNNHGAVNPFDGNPCGENISLIELPDYREGGDLNHEDGKSCFASISGNFENNNDSRKYQYSKFWTFYD